jgi:3D (Asp-Asp-Asp) domain-containing protein
LNSRKRLAGLLVLIMLSACSTEVSYDIVLQKGSESPYLGTSTTAPYRIVEVKELVAVSDPETIEIPFTSDRTGYTWLLSKVRNGTPSQKSITYRITYDLNGNILSKVELKGSDTLIEAIPTAYQYGANVSVGSYFYAKAISRYGYDCVGCGVQKDMTSSTSTLIRLSANAVRQSNGEWKQGITYDGYYIVAADKAFPLCTVLTISNHHLSGSGIKEGVPFKVLVIDRGGAITTNRLDFFVGTETYLDTVVHKASSQGTKVTVSGFLKWKRNSLGQMTCVK